VIAVVDVFDLDRTLVADYASFARSFTEIRAQDIQDQVDAIYASRRFWPEPLITVNPHFERGASVEALVRDGSLHPDVARVFRVDGHSISLYRHQLQAVAKATARQSFAVTTGTGSGKSLCFFIPIIDAAIRARAAGEASRTRAIVIYPMNALANSQREELTKFLDQSGLPESLRPTFARYTGQEGHDERVLISEAKPDILLTNFMMLELLMTRQNKLDQTVIENAQGLDFIVLDELHTYRGRQGADVAMLVRRLRDRLCPDRAPLCIGTSATMSSQEDETERTAAVAAVASRLFGTDIPPHAVIDETLERATDPTLKPQSLGSALANAIDTDLPAALTDEELRAHPLAVWIELEIGLQDGQQLRRRLPTTLAKAAKRLADQTGCDEGRCRLQLQAMLMMMSRPVNERGGEGERAFLAFKLHRFISGAGHVYATLREPAQRRVTLDGQRFDPQDPDARLYATFFCRNCGQVRAVGQSTAAAEALGVAIVPETAAEVAGFAKSTSRAPGLYVMVDVGAMTLDVCAFRLSEQDFQDRYALLAAHVRPLGVEALYWFLAHEKDEPGFAQRCDRCVREVVWGTRRNRDSNAECWRRGNELPVFLVGGGADNDLHRRVVEALHPWLRQYVSNNGIRLLELPVPTNIELPVGISDFRRLAVAWGLSYPPNEVGKILPPSSIEDMPEAKAIDLSHRLISKELV
jgi:DEAD/DEAH box helicase